MRVESVPQSADYLESTVRQQLRNHRRSRKGVMGLDRDGHPKPFGEWDRCWSTLVAASICAPAGACSSVQRTAVNANERGFPIVGEFEEPVELGANGFDGEQGSCCRRSQSVSRSRRSLLDPGAFGSGYRGIKHLAVDEP